MTIHGVSQSTLAPRLLEIEKADDKLLLHVHDQPPATREQIVVPAAALVATLTEASLGPTTLEGTSPVQERRKLLDIEVRRNEVLLWVRPEAGTGWDIAVGFDDLQDALEATM
jgi:hypothetical protein